MIGVADVVGWGVIVAHVACAGLLVRYGKPLKCSHRILYTYLVVLIASFVSMMRLDENHGLQIEIFAMVAAALLVVSLPSAGGYRTKRVGFMVTFPLFGAEKSVLKLVGANLKDGQNVLVL